jgi:uncharacterized membrane protein
MRTGFAAKGDPKMFLNRVVTVAALAVGGMMLKKQMEKKQGRMGASESSSITESIEVGVPVRTAYNQWTQFEDFPQFMASVTEIRQLDDRRLHWKAKVMGEEKEWNAEITEQIPDKRIAWRSTSGAPNSGVVTFHRISNSCTRVTLQLSYEPEGAMEKLGDMLGAMRLEARQNLQRYKEMLEKRGQETGAWRGAIPQQSSSPSTH